MLALLSGRFRRLLFFMIAVPISGRVLEMVGPAHRGPAGSDPAQPGATGRRLHGGAVLARATASRAAAAARAAEQQYAAAPGSGVNGHGAAANEARTVVRDAAARAARADAAPAR